ncbi:cobalamin B12-binding domain-containing protein [Dactylosporangium sp. NPDC048998]|uniref:cobalamin B12-binding domain-containing protein n=1 Tax=Dactylosporangium sp. NPDC048998 TaxID=3363976 RepID=UPI003718D730
MALETVRARPLTVVLTSLSSDAHTWNLVYLQLVLEEMRCRVINLGACTPDETILAACVTQAPDLLVISSINGHGVHDGLRLIRALRAVPGLAALPAVIGGRLDATGGADRSTAERLIDAGFDSVFEDAGGITTFRSMVHRIAADAAVPDGGAQLDRSGSGSGEPIGAR